MTESRASQVSAQALTSVDPETRLSRAALQGLVVPVDPDTRMSRVAIQVLTSVVPYVYGARVTWWDGTARQTGIIRGWWDGATIQPTTIKGWWNGSSLQPVS